MILEYSGDWVDDLHSSTMAPEYIRILDDPVLAEATRRSNRSNQLHWAAANISHPGEPVAANVSVETLAIARDIVRCGLSEAAIGDAYRICQNVAWRLWMQVAFSLTADRAELHELLDVTACSIASFVDSTVAEIHRQLQLERDQLAGETHAERREIVTSILGGAPVAMRRAQERLGYILEQAHTAAVVWADESSTDLSDLDRAAEALSHTVNGSRPLLVLANTATRWMWIPGGDGVDLARVAATMTQLSRVRIALGATEAGIEGFRRSHLDAISTQRMMTRLGPGRQIATFRDVELTALITADPGEADRFIKNTLGDLEGAGPELKRTVLTFIHEGRNASRTAARLFIHRNTLQYRLARAEELLPRPLKDNSAHVVVALEALAWRSSSRPHDRKSKTRPR